MTVIDADGFAYPDSSGQPIEWGRTYGTAGDHFMLVRPLRRAKFEQFDAHLITAREGPTYRIVTSRVWPAPAGKELEVYNHDLVRLDPAELGRQFKAFLAFMQEYRQEIEARGILSPPTPEKEKDP